MHHKQYEAIEQTKLFRWAEWAIMEYPELKLLHHIPNGGSRNPAEAANLKRQGVRAGVPDLSLPVARGGYHGLYIEMKFGDNKPTAKQREWIKALREQGYAISICWSYEAARDEIVKYLKSESERNEYFQQGFTQD